MYIENSEPQQLVRLVDDSTFNCQESRYFNLFINDPRFNFIIHNLDETTIKAINVALFQSEKTLNKDELGLYYQDAILYNAASMLWVSFVESEVSVLNGFKKSSSGSVNPKNDFIGNPFNDYLKQIVEVSVIGLITL